MVIVRGWVSDVVVYHSKRVWLKCIIFDVFLIHFTLFSSSLHVAEKGILTMSLGSILNE